MQLTGTAVLVLSGRISRIERYLNGSIVSVLSRGLARHLLRNSLEELHNA